MELAADIRRLVDQRPTYGYRRIAALLKRDCHHAGAAACLGFVFLLVTTVPASAATISIISGQERSFILVLGRTPACRYGEVCRPRKKCFYCRERFRPARTLVFEKL
jgi:hypothetical protein